MAFVLTYSGKTLKPPLKYAGGKRWLVPHLRPIWEKCSSRRLVEPFCGGLGITMGLLPERALLNDLNPHLMHFYGWLKHGLNISIRMANEEELYYTHRDRFNELLRVGQADSAEAAALFYYLNRTCFNGLCRFNNKGEFNVPFGRYKRINYQFDFSVYKGTFARWDFCACDFASLELQPDDFIYADPPYDMGFTRYVKEAFSWEDQERTAAWLTQHPGPVLVSNQATPRIVELYKKLGYSLTFLEGPRRINSTGDRSPVQEVIARRNI